MRELRSCDFCDADAAGTFVVVPPELEPTEAEQRRVVLCPDCRDRLESLLEPLIARAGVDDGTERTRTEPATERRDEGTDGTVVATADESTPKRPRDSSPNATVSEADDADGDTDSQLDPALEDGITVERSPPGGTDADDPDDVPASEHRESAGDDGTEARESTARPPRAYGKVVRLLRNREFPMKRTAVENLAAGAYDLESHEVEAIVDRAIERDEFVEKRGKLRRPDD